MKKIENIIPKKVEIAEVIYLEENQQLENYNPLQGIALPENFDLLKSVSKSTYFALSPNQLEELKTTAEKVFKLTNETLLEIIKQEENDPWINFRYGVVKSLWRNSNTGLSLMRIDFAWDQEGNLKVLELNAANQAGWIKNYIIEKEIRADKVGLPLSPQPIFYSKYVREKLGSKIAIIFLDGCYNKELKLIAQQIASFGGKCKVFCLSETTIPEIIDFSPTGLFWKCNASLIDYAPLVLRLSELGLPQVPSFESLFIAGDKSFLTNLKDKDDTGAIPLTCSLSKDDLAQNLNFLDQDKAVLKPGDLGRGKGVKFGKNFTKEVWEEKIKGAMNSQQAWVIQERCYLRNTPDGRYEDIAVYLIDGVAQGFLSRISVNEVVNIHNGGLFQPTVLIE